MRGRSAATTLLNVGWIGQIPGMEMGPCCYSINVRFTGSITPFGVEQKANIIVTLVEIMLTFWLLQNVIRILNLDSLLHCCKCWTKVNFGQNLDNILSGSKDKIMFGFCSTQYSVIM
jgi:hypothetical protein